MRNDVRIIVNKDYTNGVLEIELDGIVNMKLEIEGVRINIGAYVLQVGYDMEERKNFGKGLRRGWKDYSRRRGWLLG